MESRPKINMKNKITNFFGGLGYLACIVQWLWTVLLFIEPIKDFLIIFVPTIEERIDKPQIAVLEYNPLIAIISTVITIIFLGLSIYLIYKVPTSLAKNSNRIVHETTKAVTPLIIKATHQKQTKKILLKLTARIVFFIKLFLIVAPLILVLASGLIDKQVFEARISITTGIFLASVSLLWFSIEYTLAKIFHIKFSEIW